MFFFSCVLLYPRLLSFFFFNDTATTEIYTLSLHDALPISCRSMKFRWRGCLARCSRSPPSSRWKHSRKDRKSTRLNSSHQIISYAVFCLKKKKHKKKRRHTTRNVVEMRSSPLKLSRTQHSS